MSGLGGRGGGGQPRGHRFQESRTASCPDHSGLWGLARLAKEASVVPGLPAGELMGLPAGEGVGLPAGEVMGLPGGEVMGGAYLVRRGWGGPTCWGR